MDDLERMIEDSKMFNKRELDIKRQKIERDSAEYDFKTLLDAVELLYELRAKRQKEEKDKELISIIEGVLKEEPFEYEDEDFILISHKSSLAITNKYKKRQR